MSVPWNLAAFAFVLANLASGDSATFSKPTGPPGVITNVPPHSTNSIKTNQPAKGETPARIPAFPLQTNDCLVFIGGTTTVGEAKHAYLETLLTRRYPGYKLRFRDLGWEADTVFSQERPLNFPNLAQSVKAQRATVILSNFGLMESLNGPGGLTNFVQAYETLLNGLTNITSRIVLISPMRFESTHRSIQESTDRNKNLALYVDAIRKLAAQRKFSFVDLFKLQNRNAAQEDSTRLTLDGLHPSAYGYWRAANEFERSLALIQPDWEVEVDVGNRSYHNRGTQITEFQSSISKVQFRAIDDMLPAPVFNQTDGSVTISNSRTFKVSGLLPGRYVLKIDGVPLYQQSERFWEQGRSLTHAPDFTQSDRLRQLVLQKNSDFMNYWRPENWAFLNGDLTSQPSSHRHDDFSARWFPGEMQSFPPLIAKKEDAIDKLARPTIHTYELRRIE